MIDKDVFEIYSGLCRNYDDNDEVCKTCSRNNVQKQQSCFSAVAGGRAEGDGDKIHPDHYKLDGRRECIEEMIILFGKERVADWCKITAYKYLYRHGSKKGESAGDDLKKMEYYLNKAKELTEHAEKVDPLGQFEIR